MKGFTLDIFIFGSRPVRKSENLMRCVSFLNVGPVQKPTAVLFSTDEGNFFFQEKNDNNEKKILEKNVARIISNM